MRLSIFLALALSFAGSICFSAPGPTLVVEKLQKDSGFLTVTFNAQGFFSTRMVETLTRGLPATLTYEIQLWKKRRLWMDKLTQVNTLSYKIRYDPWEDGYRIQTKNGSSASLLDIGHVERSLCVHAMAKAGSVDAIDPTATHYVVIKATMRPVSAEDIDQVESWLSDGKPEGRRGITAVPGYLFDVIVGLSGFGDEAVSARSQPFLLADLTSAEKLAD
ncbi:MAG: DUF4390 domain-containing protein [Candidatus Eisenbacteria bacterium]|nr:DUF4390 domain-containing protein [Candidatus Eisenbacteria bacterium]